MMNKLSIRNHHIDFLRGLAILSVLTLHFHLSYHLDQSLINEIFSINFIKRVAGNGNYGVTIFFVISGFLITSISLDRYKNFGKIALLEFYVYRFARIMPCLLLALIVILNFFPIPIFKNSQNSTTLIIAITSVLTFWHNILMQKIGCFNYCLNIYWSLSVEEVFYMVFPLICLFFKKIWFILFLCGFLIIIAPIYRARHHDNEIIALYGYFSCFDAIAMGCCTAIISRKVCLKGWGIKTLNFSAWLLLISIYMYRPIMDNIAIDVSLVALSTAVLLFVAKIKMAETKSTSNFVTRFIGWLGENSYELYLFHIIVLALMKEIYNPTELNGLTKLIWFCLFFITSILVSSTISKFYSRPVNKKLRSLFFTFHLQASTSI